MRRDQCILKITLKYIVYTYQIKYALLELNKFIKQDLMSNDLHWDMLSRNPSAIDLLSRNPTKIDWDELSQNPSIFEYDYDAMKDRMYGSGICEALMANRSYSSNHTKWRGWGLMTWYQMVCGLTNEIMVTLSDHHDTQSWVLS